MVATKPQQKAGIYAEAEKPQQTAAQAPAQADQPGGPHLLDRVLEETALRLDREARQFAEAVADPARGRLERAIVMARGILRLKELLTDKVMNELLPLMNTPLGFKTDRGPHNPKLPTPYTKEEVKDCIVVGLLNGVYPLFNEMNIIAGSCYITKEGYQRKVREIPGLTDLIPSPGTPIQHNGQTCVRFGASWKYKGIPGRLQDQNGAPGIVIAIPTNQYTGPDAIVGKATRKGLKRVYEQITGSEQTQGCADDDGEIHDEQPTPKSGEAAPSKAEALAAKMGTDPTAAADLVKEVEKQLGDAAE